MCTRAGAPAPRSAAVPQAAAAAPVVQAAAAPAPQPRTGGLTSDTGVQDMDDATLASFLDAARRRSVTADGRQNTIAQRIADALGLSANKPESVPQEALAQHRSQVGDAGTLYRTVDDVTGGPTGRQIAHDLTDSTDYGLNFGGGRVWGTGLYFAGKGRLDSRSAASHSSSYGYGPRYGSYTIEAHLKPTAKIARDSDLTGAKARNWAKSHTTALRRIGLGVDASGNVHDNNGSWSRVDIHTTVAMLMGYDGYSNDRAYTPYYTIWNRGVLQVARGNKYSRADSGQI